MDCGAGGQRGLFRRLSGAGETVAIRNVKMRNVQ
jgi:hypothetical protein